jgi:hypothetical protein
MERTSLLCICNYEVVIMHKGGIISYSILYLFDNFVKILFHVPFGSREYFNKISVEVYSKHCLKWLPYCLLCELFYNAKLDS